MLRVLIPSCTDKLLQNCLESMERMQPGSAASVIVGNNGLHPEFNGRWPNAIFIDVPGSPFVYADAINDCAAAADPDDDFLILGDDTEILSFGWLERCESLMAHWPKLFGLINLCESSSNETDLFLKTQLKTQVHESLTTFAFVATLIPHFIWNEIGPMDQSFTGYGWDDTDYCVRVLHAGYRLGITGAAMIQHQGTASYRRAVGEYGIQELSLINHDRFHEKWGLPIPRPAEMKFLPIVRHFNHHCECISQSSTLAART